MTDKPPIDPQINAHYLEMLERAWRKGRRKPAPPDHAAKFIAESKRRSRRRRALSSKVEKLKEMREDRGASPNEAAFARRKREELAAELATIPKPAPFAPQYLHRRPSIPGRRSGSTAKPTLYLDVTERALTQRINRALPR